MKKYFNHLMLLLLFVYQVNLVLSRPENIGLSQVRLSAIQNNELKNKQKIVFSLPTARTLRYAAAAVLLFGMLIISPEVNDVKRTGSANLVSLSFLKAPEASPVVEVEPELIESSELVEAELTTVEVVSAVTESFHVIVASLPTKESADKYCEFLKGQNFESAHVLDPVRTYRISIKSFSDRGEAIQFMQELRKTDERFVTSWVYCD